jgi:hypothetical protein
MSENTAPEAAQTPAEESTESVDYKAEAEKWKAMARKQESRAKENHAKLKEYEELKAAQMTETERAIAAARDEGAAAVRAEYASKLVSTTFRAAARGRVSDPDALLAGLDTARFLTEDGEPDEAAIGAFLDAVAPAKEEAPQSPAPGLFDAAGARNTPSAMPLNGNPLLEQVMKLAGVKNH